MIRNQEQFDAVIGADQRIESDDWMPDATAVLEPEGHACAMAVSMRLQCVRYASAMCLRCVRHVLAMLRLFAECALHLPCFCHVVVMLLLHVPRLQLKQPRNYPHTTYINAGVEAETPRASNATG